MLSASQHVPPGRDEERPRHPGRQPAGRAAADTRVDHMTTRIVEGMTSSAPRRPRRLRAVGVPRPDRRRATGRRRGNDLRVRITPAVEAATEPDLERFRSEAVAFLAQAKADVSPARPTAPSCRRACTSRLGRGRATWPKAASPGCTGQSSTAAVASARASPASGWRSARREQVSPYLNLQGLVLAGGAILRSGTDEQRARFLPPTLSGDILWCQLFSEPGAGSDLTSLTTSALTDGDRYVVTGTKVWSSNAQHAELGILLARTDPDQPGHRGISFFLLDMGTPGIEVRPIRQMTGDSEFCEVFLDGVSVPAQARLGTRERGLAGGDRGAARRAGFRRGGPGEPRASP